MLNMAKPMSNDEVLELHRRSYKTSWFAPTPNHRCAPGCAIMAVRDARLRHDPVFVCRLHQAVHWCGVHCDQSIYDREGMVCILTGLVTSETLVHQESQKPDFFGRVPQRMHMAKSTNPSKAQHRSEIVAKWVRVAVIEIFCSKQRTNLLNINCKRLSNMRKKLQRAYVPFPIINATLLKYCKKIQVSFNSPVDKTHPEIHALIKDITIYAIRYTQLNNDSKTIFAFSAVCIEKLRTGINICGIQMFPCRPFVLRHAPPQNQCSALGKIKSRYMTRANRMIRQQMIGPGGLPNRGWMFPT